MTQFYIS